MDNDGTTPIVIDAWSGTGSASNPWRDMGFEVITIDYDESFGPDICADILDVTPEKLKGYINAKLGPDRVIYFFWASPSCTLFSLMNMRWKKHYDHVNDYEAVSDEAKEHNKRVEHTLHLIKMMEPKYWVMENPRALMRKMPYMRAFERHTVTYCSYGHPTMKPTDLFGRLPYLWQPLNLCSNGAGDRGECHHISAPRGSRTGIQGMDSVDAAVVPELLVLSLIHASVKSHGISREDQWNHWGEDE